MWHRASVSRPSGTAADLLTPCVCACSNTCLSSARLTQMPQQLGQWPLLLQTNPLIVFLISLREWRLRNCSLCCQQHHRPLLQEISLVTLVSSLLRVELNQSLFSDFWADKTLLVRRQSSGLSPNSSSCRSSGNLFRRLFQETIEGLTAKWRA